MEIKGATHIISSITYQTLFKYYPKLSGMTVRHPESQHFVLASLAIFAGAWAMQILTLSSM